MSVNIGQHVKINNTGSGTAIGLDINGAVQIIVASDGKQSNVGCLIEVESAGAGQTIGMRINK